MYYYCFAAPRTPAVQPLQTPAPLPLPKLLAQRFVMLVSSPGLSSADKNALSVIWKVVVDVGGV